MKTLISLTLALLTGCGGYHFKVARFIDESEASAKVWLCVKDEDPVNADGIQCADFKAVLEMQQVRGAPTNEM